LWNFIKTAETAVREQWALRAVFYGLIAAALLLTWIYTGGAGVDFVYSEF